MFIAKSFQATSSSSEQVAPFLANLLRYERHTLARPTAPRRLARNDDQSRQRRDYLFESALVSGPPRAHHAQGRSPFHPFPTPSASGLSLRLQNLPSLAAAQSKGLIVRGRICGSSYAVWSDLPGGLWPRGLCSSPVRRESVGCGRSRPLQASEA